MATIFNEDNTIEQMMLSTLRRMGGNIFLPRNFLVCIRMYLLNQW